MLCKILGYTRGFFRLFSLRNWKPFRLDGGFTLIKQHADVEIGERAHLWPGVKISAVGRPDARASVKIGARSAIGDRTQIHACHSVTIGERVLISWDVNIIENNYHAPSKGPILIGDDVWIGCRSIILNGVTIGRGAVIGAGSVVTKNVPDGRFFAGNPAEDRGEA